MARHVRKGDTVIVTSGSHRGKTGRIREILTKKDRVIVEGVNMVTKHQKPTRLNPQGGVITKEASIHISNVSPVVDGKPSRVRFTSKANGQKVRVAVRGGGELGVVRHAASAPAKSTAPKSTPAKSAGPSKSAGAGKSAAKSTSKSK
jgi:large subunit ribosomal protein L24